MSNTLPSPAVQASTTGSSALVPPSTLPIVRVAQVSEYVDQPVRLEGWLFNKRSSKKLHFLQLRDGSAIIQCVLSKEDGGDDLFALADSLNQESAIRIDGIVKKDERSPLGYELHVTDVELVHLSVDYPITKKAHGDAFLMDHRHLWLRSLRQQIIIKIRHTIVKAIRDYFDDRGFVLVDSPILTPNPCEGTSNLFETPYFERKAYLSQSGQLYQEAAAMAFGRSYCFGPTFRAEKSKTRRHLTEFWMVEPEVAYMDLEGDMDLAEDFLRFVVEKVLEKHTKQLKNILKRDVSKLEVIKKPFVRLSYCQAVEEIKEIAAASDDPDLKELLAIEWGMDFGSRHETELTKRYDSPIIIHGFPSAVKAFYMKHDDNNPKISRSMDILAPEGYGEIIGGGQREESIEVLEKAIKEHDLPAKDFNWFLDLRRFGSVPHSGFGMGLERCVAWVCGLHHVRETIPFARTMDRLEP